MTTISWHYELAPSTSCTALQRQGPRCRPGPGPLEEQGVSHHRRQRPVLGHSGPSCRGACLLPGARPTNPQGAARLHSAHVAIVRTSGGRQHPGGGHLRWCLQTEHPLEGGGRGRPRRQARPLSAPAPSPAASWARDEAWGWRTQTRHLEGHGRRPGPRSSPRFRGDLRWDGVASEVTVTVRRGLEGWGGQRLHPWVSREGLKAADRGSRTAGVGHPGHIHTPTA